MLIFLLVIGVLYMVLILSFRKGWKQISLQNEQVITHAPFVSIVIATREEEANIENLLCNLSNQDYDPSGYEIIVINDHSVDRTLDVLKNCLESFPKLRIFDLDESSQGKKKAIAKGIEEARGKLIVTIDADCSTGRKWLKSIISCYLQYEPQLIIGPVVYKNEKGFFKNFQDLEFLSLTASGAGAVGLGKAFMCNGANLIFQKKVYEVSQNELRFHLASGDDIFLLQSIKKRKEKIIFLKSLDAIVYTKAVDDFKSFLQQRKRWASKTSHYSDAFTFYVAFIIGFTNFALVGALLLSVFHPEFLLYFFLLFILKSCADLVLLKPYAEFFGKAHLMQYFWPSQLLYPFYIVWMTFYASWGSYKWKNRKHNIT